ncbi:hypothetical protein G6F57_003438 [Rhizopus arrhizus]|uniref:PH domain-containing protein n=1 Tax=Rhizopus oryzae TaxID=64495 RepID=A0A9P6XDE3_RHIOR|nr:hypothetical protein G6F23_004320 [Rhizopus arrhizus]KAG1426557.1 hypothetical protein G6F58_001415 [Rhizopus delemar]KAG0769272.1 hypothetical protein G6F24_001210 [Rhizopus arrhizus]KAG0793019.1 hypothetical protein G6F21_003932 [Rhizopus arrhizus]KAG0801938.1 hypothetical protein G6F22_000756 [Rhizopus arrhizus]
MISNPILDQSSTSLLMDKPHLKDSDALPLMRQNSRFSKNKFRNSFLLPKDRIKSIIHHPLMNRQKTPSEPIIHYNGPFETLDQLPEDKYEWIVSESFDMNDQPANPLLDYPRSVVFRKPHHINASAFGFHGTQTQRPKAKGTFYIRVLQVNNQYLSKTCHIKPSITIEDEVFYGSCILSQRCGKIGTQATMDETYLIDFYGESTATLSVHSRAKNFFGSISSHFNKPEICLGSHEFDITISPSEKKIERITLQNSETDDQYQILVVYGTFVSTNVMTLLQNKLIYEGYITVYTKGRYTPRWNRYWATLSPEGFELYDFEYKEKRKVLYKIPLGSLLEVFHPPIDDDERLVDVGSLGLALQFSEHVLDETEEITDVLEYRMYVLPDDLKSCKEWESAFTEVAALIKEYRFDDCFNATRFDRDDKSMFISIKFLW